MDFCPGARRSTADVFICVNPPTKLLEVDGGAPADCSRHWLLSQVYFHKAPEPEPSAQYVFWRESTGGLARSNEVRRVYAAVQTFSTTVVKHFPFHFTCFCFLPTKVVAVVLCLYIFHVRTQGRVLLVTNR